MRPITLSLILAFGISAAPLAAGAAQTPPDSTKADSAAKVKKPPSKLSKIAKGAAGTAATAAAGVGVQAALGKNASGVANALGAAGAMPCGPGYGVTAGAAIVGAAKDVVKKATDTGQAAAADPCARAGGIPGMPGGIPGMPAGMPGIPGMPSAGAMAGGVASGVVSGVVGAAAGGGNPMGNMGGMGAVMGLTPIGLAASAAPGAIKGVKGLLGGKPQDKIAMLRELGKGRLELKGVKFIEGTAELEPGYEASFAALGEAIPLSEGTYILYIAAEAGEKDTPPDTALARKRIEKAWAAILVNGVSDQRIVALTVLPKELAEGRKPPKRGQARVEILRAPNEK